MLLEIRVLFVLLMMNWFFVLTVETSLIDKDGRCVFFSVLRKCNLGRLFLRPDMVFFVCYCGCVCCEKLGCFSFFL